jgi:hypothetical protein
MIDAENENNHKGLMANEKFEMKERKHFEPREANMSVGAISAVAPGSFSTNVLLSSMKQINSNNNTNSKNNIQSSSNINNNLNESLPWSLLRGEYIIKKDESKDSLKK